MVAGAGGGAVFQGLDRAEKVVESDFVALRILRIEQPLVGGTGYFPDEVRPGQLPYRVWVRIASAPGSRVRSASSAPK